MPRLDIVILILVLNPDFASKRIDKNLALVFSIPAEVNIRIHINFSLQ